MDDELEQRAKSGEHEAQMALAQRFASQNKSALARMWFARAARSGSVAALRCLAISLLTQEPVDGDEGVGMIRAASDRGDPEAAHLCALLAAQDSNLHDRWIVAENYLATSVERGWPLAIEEFAFLKGEDVPHAAAPLREVFDSPRIATIEAFASAKVCDWLINRARPRLSPALVYDHAAGHGRVAGARSNSAVTFDISQLDMILMRLRERIAASTNIPRVSLERSSILHYLPGQEFVPHFDFLDASEPGYAGDLKKNGQRVATFLLYLNDDYEGGETYFPTLDWRYKGKKGDALVFWNVDSAGAPDRRMLHAGVTPTQGEKWLLSQWLRQSP